MPATTSFAYLENSSAVERTTLNALTCLKTFCLTQPPIPSTAPFRGCFQSSSTQYEYLYATWLGQERHIYF